MKNESKITIMQAIRVIVNIVAMLLAVSTAIFWEDIPTMLCVICGCVLLWFTIDTGITKYLEVLFERES